ncbi:MAG: RNA polymerase sigma factor [Candidatus Wallacebacter cryptica]|jgi:RNA polymerase sigma factor (sigma-70 family)|nr:RNA polymerase sigma factor [Bacillota bacterium]
MAVNEFELITKIKQGDRNSMAEIFEAHVDAAVRLAYMITHDWSTAEDAVQEAFIQAFRSIKSFKDGMAFKPWFSKIVINKSKRIKQKFRVDPEYIPNTEENPHLAFSPEDQTLVNEESGFVYEAINQLDEKHRLPIILKYLSGLTEKEIAEVLKIPQSTVKSRLYTARQRLKTALTAAERGEQGA